jgi:hypothetical protein
VPPPRVSPALVHRWRLEDKDFARTFALAREAGFEAIAEEALEIADDDAQDFLERKKPMAPPRWPRTPTMSRGQGCAWRRD